MTMTHEQELFDRVAKHLLKQGAKAQKGLDNRKVCQYHSPDGLRCAIGCLITPEYYSPGLEGDTIEDSPAVVDAVQASLGYDLTGEELHLLEHLQTVHDEHEPRAWPMALEVVADEFKLNPEVLR